MMNNGTNGLTAADVAAVTGNNNGNMFGNDWAWIIILLLFGYGGRGFGGFGGGMPCGTPATQADVRSAVDQQTLISKLDQQTYGIADSTYALNDAIKNGFYGVDRAICDIGHQVSDCCCTTQRSIDNLRFDAATQACDTRNTIQNTTRDIIDNQNANSRAILDFLVQDKLATKDARIAQLENKLSQSEQNAVIMAAMDANTATILRRTGAECPTAAYLVQPPTPVNFPVNGCGQVQFGNQGCCGSF
jgi:hypothetical protein